MRNLVKDFQAFIMPLIGLLLGKIDFCFSEISAKASRCPHCTSTLVG